MSHKAFQRFRVHSRFSHNATIGVTADVWSDTRHLQPLGKKCNLCDRYETLMQPYETCIKICVCSHWTSGFQPEVLSVFVISHKHEITKSRGWLSYFFKGSDFTKSFWSQFHTKSRAFSPTFSAFFKFSQVTECHTCTKNPKAADCEKLYFAEDGPFEMLPFC